MWVLAEDEDRIINSQYIIQSYIELDTETDKYLLKAELVDGSTRILGSYYYRRYAWRKFLRIAKGEERKDIEDRENRIIRRSFYNDIREIISIPSKVGRWLFN